MTPGASRKLSKSTAGYREGDDTLNCGTCMHFKKPTCDWMRGADGHLRAPACSCLLVEGQIEMHFWCGWWARKEGPVT